MIYYTEKYGNKRELHTGQKVECVYYHEYVGKKDCYQRPWWQKLTDLPFKPVKLGIIEGDAGIHPYWLGSNDTEQYLFVRFREYRFPKAIPISCIRDAKESANMIKNMLERDKDKVGQKGYDFDSFMALSEQAQKADNFCK